jgi:predicted transcriptional regulator
MEIRSLTRAETEIMKILWQLEKAFIKDILALMPDPKPAYNTVSTFIRILEKKKVIDHITYGNTHQYFPLITEEEFKRHEIQQLMANYFDNSVSNLVSFFVNENNLQNKDFEELRDFIKKNEGKQ